MGFTDTIRTASGSASPSYRLPDLVTVAPGGQRVSSLSEKAYYLLRDRLITLQLPPGSTLDERTLQHELNVGRTPLREALRKLADERLVRVIPRRGMFASHVDLGDLSAVSEVRVELESYAGYLAASRITASEQQNIGELLEQVDRQTENSARAELIQLDLRIHRRVYRTTHNTCLARTLEEYYLHSLRMWFLVLDRIEHLAAAVKSHRELLEAVHTGDADAAEQILRKHVAGFEQEIRAVL